MPKFGDNVGDLARLRKKYQLLNDRFAQLRQTHTELIHRHTEQVKKRFSLVAIGRWLLGTQASGIAVIRDGAILIANRRFKDLVGPAKARRQWILTDGKNGNGQSYSSLTEALLHSAADMRGRLLIQRYEDSESEMWVEVRYEAPDEESRSERPIVVSAYDITVFAKAERELEQTREQLDREERMRALGELASGVAHDLNNVLNSMRLGLALLSSGPLEDSQRTHVQNLDRCVKDAGRRVGRLQDFARLRRDRPGESIRISEIIRQAIELAHSGVEEKSAITESPIKIVAEVPELPPVVGVGAEVSHVLLNLILNARDAMPSGGFITIKAEPRDTAVILTIEDQGTGISQSALGHIFEPFFTTKGSRGSGLGLSTAHNVMERLGGSIRAANRPGGGAIFTLTFPTSPQEPKSSDQLMPIGTTVSRRVLIVDDDDMNLESMTALLTQVGHRIETARNGLEAIKRIRAGEKYDLVLCDVGMPVMSGWAVAREIKNRSPEIPVYMLTGWADEIGLDDPRREMVTDILPKPIQVERLSAILAG